MRCKLYLLSIVILTKSLTYGESSTVDPLLNKMALSSFEKLISKEEIDTKLQEIALQIDQDSNGEDLILITVLKGGLLLTADLMRKVTVPCTLEHVQASSYGKNGTLRQNLTIQGLEKLNVSGKNVLIIDDIFDSGATLSTIVDKVSMLKPKSLRSLVLLLKKTAHVTTYRPNYILFEIENRFVIGYGLDYKEHWRGLSDIFALQ